MKKKIISTTLVLVGFVLGATALSVLADWTVPTCDPADGPALCNTDAPINGSATAQEKMGPLALNVTNPVSDNIGLRVLGMIKMVDGNEGVGNVLTSDADGIGSWSETLKVTESYDSGIKCPVNGEFYNGGASQHGLGYDFAYKCIAGSVKYVVANITPPYPTTNTTQYKTSCVEGSFSFYAAGPTISFDCNASDYLEKVCISNGTPCMIPSWFESNGGDNVFCNWDSNLNAPGDQSTNFVCLTNKLYSISNTDQIAPQVVKKLIMASSVMTPYSSLISGFTQGTSYPYNTLSSSGNSIYSAIETTGNIGGVVSNALSLNTSSTYRLTYTYNQTSGTAPNIRFVSSIDGRSSIIGSPSGFNVTAQPGTNSVTFIPLGTSGYIEISVGSGSMTNFSMSGISLVEL